MELDTGKIRDTLKTIKDELQPFVQNEYPNYKIDSGVLNWSVYERNIIIEHNNKSIPRIKECEKNGIKVEHVSDFLKTINFKWEKDDFYNYFKELGKQVDKMFK